MRKKVLTFYGFLLGITFVLMFFQVAKYGSFIGYIHSESIDEGKITNEQGYALSLIGPSKMLIYAGSGKIGFLKILNSGTAPLSNCFIKGEGGLSEWIVPGGRLSLEPGDSGAYSFNVKVDDDTEKGEYALPFSFVCENYERKGILAVEVVRDESLGSPGLFTSSRITGLSNYDLGESNLNLASFVLIGIVLIALVGIYLHKRQRRVEQLSKVHGYGRKFIKLDLSN